MNSITVYSFDRLTGIYIGETAADESPLEPGVFLDPAFSKREAPPACKPGTVAVSDGDGWRVVTDCRGETWFKADGTPVIIDFPGDPVAAGLLNVAPPPPPVDLEKAKASAIAQVIAFADGITAPITSAYPASEVASWPVQSLEAQTVLAGRALPDTALLPMLAGGADLTEFAKVVIAKATAYNAIVAAVQAIRSQAQTLIGAATSADEISAILEQLKAAALAKAAEFDLL